MNRKLALASALLLAASALPARAQEYVGEEQGGWFGDEAPQQPEAAPGEEYAAPVDVSVDMASPNGSVSIDTFQEGLGSQGEWVTTAPYGRVWRPAGVAPGWRPYYYGRWEWTDEGWLWVSDEPWGWATYHYGRWAYDNGMGWLWVPGFQWAPAWVTWRYSPDYIGWAPLGPGFSVYVTAYPAVYSWWTFVPCERFVGVPVYTVGYTGSRVQGLWRSTRPAPPRAFVGGARSPAWGGPARPFVENRIGRAVVPVRVQPVGSPGALAAPRRAGVVSVYRPELRPAPRGYSPGAVAAPGRSRGAAPGGAAAPRPWGGQPSRPAAPAPYAGRPSAPSPQQNRWAPQQVRPAAPAPQPMQNRYAPPQAAGRHAPPPQQYQPPREYRPPVYRAPAQALPRAPAPAPQQQGGGGHPAPAHGANPRER